MKIHSSLQNLTNYKKYHQILSATKEYLDKKGYLEIDLPVLSPALVPESYLEVFQTEFKYLDKKEKLYLTSSPELFLKRILAYGAINCYYLGKAFRNSESYSSLHSFEFTMLEFYKTKASYLDIADELLGLLQYINKKRELSYQNHKISLQKWEKLTVAQAFQEFAGISEKELFNHEKFLEKSKKKGYKTEGFSYEDLFSQIYTQEIEPRLGTHGYPTLIYDYPKEFAAFAKLNEDGKTAQRFEFYIQGIELGDCYTELTDWEEQDKRFKDENTLRKKADKISHPIDEGFIDALKYGLTDCAGVAIGFERLVMIFADTTSIHDLKLIDVY